MKKIALALLIVVLVLVVVSFIRLSVPNSFDVSKDSLSGEAISVVFSVKDSKISLDKLSNHDKQSDCWVAYSGKVYDVTSFLPRHLGSAAAIIPFCGTSEDFTEAFEKQHGTSKVGNLMRVSVLIGDFDIIGEI